MTANDPGPDRPMTRANSLSALERVLDVAMMIVFVHPWTPSP